MGVPVESNVVPFMSAANGLQQTKTKKALPGRKVAANWGASTAKGFVVHPNKVVDGRPELESVSEPLGQPSYVSRRVRNGENGHSTDDDEWLLEIAQFNATSSRLGSIHSEKAIMTDDGRASSLTSWGDDDFDRDAALRVAAMFSEIDEALYEGKTLTDQVMDQECKDWRSKFPHLRLIGRRILPQPTSSTSSTVPSARPSSVTIQANPRRRHQRQTLPAVKLKRRPKKPHVNEEEIFAIDYGSSAPLPAIGASSFNAQPPNVNVLPLRSAVTSRLTDYTWPYVIETLSPMLTEACKLSAPRPLPMPTIEPTMRTMPDKHTAQRRLKTKKKRNPVPMNADLRVKQRVTPTTKLDHIVSPEQKRKPSRHRSLSFQSRAVVPAQTSRIISAATLKKPKAVNDVPSPRPNAARANGGRTIEFTLPSRRRSVQPVSRLPPIDSADLKSPVSDTASSQVPTKSSTSASSTTRLGSIAERRTKKLEVRSKTSDDLLTQFDGAFSSATPEHIVNGQRARSRPTVLQTVSPTRRKSPTKKKIAKKPQSSNSAPPLRKAHHRPS